MTTFARFLTLNDFKALIAFSDANPRPEGKYDNPEVSAWYTKISDERDRVIVGAAMKFFKAKLKKGELKPVPNATGYRLNFVTQWDGLIAGNLESYRKKWAMEEIEQMFDRLITSPGLPLYFALYPREDVPQPAVEETYKAFIKAIDEGNFPFFTVSKYESCFRTGEFLHIQFENWTPILGRPVRNSDKGLSTFVPVEPVAEPTTTRSVQIELKTGNLIAMDWFRGIGDLREWFDERGGDNVGSVNNDSGIFATTELYASLGFVHVFVGNSSPTCFTAPGKIVFGTNWREYNKNGEERYSDVDDGEGDYDEDTNSAPVGFKDEGSVCTDLWWVTMVERERLLEVFVGQMGEEHRKEIEAYVDSQFDVNLQVEPGKYTLHYDAHPSSFYALLDDKTKYGIGTPYFALTKDTE